MIPTKVKTVLESNGLTALEFEPGSTPTSELAAQQINCQVGQIAKSMLFKGKDGVFRLIVCAGDLRVHNNKLKNTLGVKARMATAEETETITGFQPGAVCPFGVNTVKIFIDISLKRFDTIYPAAGTNASGVPVNFETLKQITDALECDVMQESII